ncbi:MAG: elongation factor G, partial [bacterium]
GDSLVGQKNGPVLEPVMLPHSVISIALKPETKKDQEKLGEALNRICAEDPTLKITQDPEFNQTVLSGLGETHLDVAVEKLRDRFGISVDIQKTRVPYRETITMKATSQGKYKKQTGGRGQYGDCFLRLEPYKEANFKFENEIVGGVIPGKYVPAVEKGVRGAMEHGIIAGYPVINIKVACYDGSYHTVDSSEMAFQIAGSMGFKSAMEKAKPALLEPVMNIEVTIPDEYLGDITGNISSRRGKVQGIEPGDGLQTVKAQVPMAELDKYSTDLKAMTQGKGDYTMSFSHYERITGKLAENVVQEAQKIREAKEKEKSEA